MTPMKKVAVIGAGTMGQGIAQWFNEQTLAQVFLVDISDVFTEKARQQISKNWDRQIEKKKITSENKNQFTSRLTVGEISSLPQDLDLIIEAVVENLQIKQDLFLQLDHKISPTCIFATNTSSFSIAAIAEPT